MEPAAEHVEELAGLAVHWRQAATKLGWDGVTDELRPIVDAALTDVASGASPRLTRTQLERLNDVPLGDRPLDALWMAAVSIIEGRLNAGTRAADSVSVVRGWLTIAARGSD